MKKILIPFNILFLLLYTSLVLRVVFPLASYALNFNYIVKELCKEKDNPENMCLGKCHLTKEIQKQVDHEDDSNKLIVLENIKVPHLLSNKFKFHSTPNLSLEFNDERSTKIIKLILKPAIPPPKNNPF